MAQLMSESFVETERSEPFSTPNSRAALQIIKRVLGQSNDLLVDLQTQNREYPELRRRFVELAAGFSGQLEQGETKKLIASAEKSRKFLRKD